uniref:Uncharacterized protein n=1 Tax=Setaria italica TaxID=4555 RepID=K3YNV8_SETIT
MLTLINTLGFSRPKQLDNYLIHFQVSATT